MNPVTVLVATDGRHLFDDIHDSRIRLTTDPSVEPQLLVFPVSRYRRFENLSAIALPPPLMRAIADGRTGLVFDASLEGVPHKPDIAHALHAVISRLGASPRQCAYVTQDRQYSGDYRAYCDSSGLVPVAIIAHDYWVWNALAEYESTGEQTYQARLTTFRGRHPMRARMFVSLNRTPRPTKILFLLRLLHDRLWERGFISFGGFRQMPDGPGKNRPSPEQLARALPEFEDLVVEVSPYLEQLEAAGRVLLGMEQHGWHRLQLGNAERAVALTEYDDSWFTVITETEMRGRPSRITEKVVKPLVNFHPLLVLGNPAALQMIRSYGFVTFEELFDEGYDDEWDPRRRFEHVYAQVCRLCATGDDEWRQLEQRVADKLIFNARWGLTRFPSVYREQRDRALVNELLAATGQSSL